MNTPKMLWTEKQLTDYLNTLNRRLAELERFNRQDEWEANDIRKRIEEVEFSLKNKGYAKR